MHPEAVTDPKNSRSQETGDLVIFTEEILNKKLPFFKQCKSQYQSTKTQSIGEVELKVVIQLPSVIK